MLRKTGFKMGLKGSVLQIGFLSCDKTCYVDVMWTSQHEKSPRNGPRLFVILLKIYTAFKALGNMQTCHFYKMRFSVQKNCFCRSSREYFHVSFSHRTPLCVNVSGRSCSNKFCVSLALSTRLPVRIVLKSLHHKCSLQQNPTLFLTDWP